MPSTRAFAVVVVGTLACLVLDLLHVASGTTFYTRPVWLGLAWWPPLTFAAANVAALAGTAAWRRAIGEAPVAGTVWPAALGFVAAYGLSAWLGRWTVPYAVVLLGAWLVRVRGQPRWVVLHGLAVAAIGSGFEIALSRAGLFGYTRPSIAGIPWWLPGIYVQVSLLAVRLETALSRGER